MILLVVILNQLALYASLGVFEVWRYNGRRLQIYQLQDREYVESASSPTFPLLPATKVEEFLEQCQFLGVTPAVRQFRAWIRNQWQNSEIGQ